MRPAGMLDPENPRRMITQVNQSSFKTRFLLHFSICLIGAAAVVLIAAACGGSDNAQTPSSPGPTTGDTGLLPQRIVSLSPGHTEILFAIGAGDQVAGVDTEADFPPEVAGRTRLNAANPNLDALAKLKADLVVITAGDSGAEQTLKNAGFQVLTLDMPASFNELFGQIDQLGEITGHIGESDALVDELDRRVLAVIQQAGSQSGPRVYHEVSADLTTASSMTFPGELYLILNATNVGGDSPEPYPRLTADQIVAADPEVIILAYEGASPDSVKSRPGWAGISAVRNDRVFALDPALVTRPGPRLVEGLQKLAQLMR